MNKEIRRDIVVILSVAVAIYTTYKNVYFGGWGDFPLRALIEGISWGLLTLITSCVMYGVYDLIIKFTSWAVGDTRDKK